MVITASKWTRRKRCFCSKVVTNSTKNGLNGRVETQKFLSFAHIVDKIKRQVWHQFHPNPNGNIHKIRKYVFIIPQQMSWISLLFSKKRTGYHRQRASSKVNTFFRYKLLIVLRPRLRCTLCVSYTRASLISREKKMNTFLKYSGKYSFLNW